MIRGISFNPRTGKWRAQIGGYFCRPYLGEFHTREEAEAARRHAEATFEKRPRKIPDPTDPRIRFAEKWTPEPNTGCWLWLGSVNVTGYGRFGIRSGEVEFAHRASWRLYRGEIPLGIFVCHHCDVRICVNPDHLFLGTDLDNMRDAARKGRIKIPSESYCSDERHQVAVLTNIQVAEIRRSDLSVRFLDELGIYPVGIEAIRAAKNYRTFLDVA
jgi:hypothetical protein